MPKNILTNIMTDPFKKAQRLRQMATEIENLNTQSVGAIRSSGCIAEELRKMADHYLDEHDALVTARTQQSYAISKHSTPITINLSPTK